MLEIYVIKKLILDLYVHYIQKNQNKIIKQICLII